MKIYKWKKSSSKIEYSSKRITVRNDSFILPDNRTIEYSILERGSVVGILAITDEKEVVVVQQYRPAIDKITIDLPGGGIDSGVTPLEEAKRELKEETGFEAKKYRLLGKFYPDSGRSEQVSYLFLATGLIAGKQQLEKNEFIQIRKIPYDQIIQLIKDNEIKETTLILGIFLFGLKF